jgi:hypothetical protein
MLHILNLGTRLEVSGQLHAPVTLNPLERTHSTPLIGGWVDLRACLDTWMKRRSPFPAPAGNETLVIQPVP